MKYLVAVTHWLLIEKPMSVGPADEECSKCPTCRSIEDHLIVSAKNSIKEDLEAGVTECHHPTVVVLGPEKDRKKW